MGTFLDRDWRCAPYLATVPPAFVAEALLPALHGWTAHKGGL